jgi:hypothetical protein
MGERSPEEIRREIESERERLGTAVGTLRTRTGALAKKLPLVALGAAGLGLAVRTTAKRALRRRS